MLWTEIVNCKHLVTQRETMALLTRSLGDEEILVVVVVRIEQVSLELQNVADPANEI